MKVIQVRNDFDNYKMIKKRNKGNKKIRKRNKGNKKNKKLMLYKNKNDYNN